MQKQELKNKLQELFKENEETFIDTLNEIWLESWENEEEKDDLPMVGIFGADWVEVLKKKIAKEIGEKYVQDPSKLATLLSVSANVEIIEKATSRQKAQAIENDPKSLDGLKEIVKHFDKENSW